MIVAWVLVRPLFKAKYLDKFDSIESTFVADARFLAAHAPHPRWQPLWYCGTRFDYIYPPALRYGTVLLSRIWIPVKAYHVYTAFLYCLGIAGVYLFARVASRSRGAAWLSALAVATVSPSFLLLPAMRQDASFLTPQRLSVLVRYGEGPHTSALALIPFALACAWYGLRGRNRAAFAGAAVFSAAVISNNFYGATALALFFPVVAWSVWVATGDRRVWLRAAAIALLAYGLTAFWLTPSYLRITMRNMRYVSNPGHLWSVALAAAIVAVYAWVTYRWARPKPDRAYLVFLAGALAAFGVNVLGNYYFDFRVAGEPSRLVPELDFVLILCCAEALRRMWGRGTGWKVAAAAVVLAAGWSATTYLRHAYSIYPLHSDYTRRIEYRIADWMHRNMPDARASAHGSVRFWYNAWFDLPQLGGGSEQVLLNPMVDNAHWEVAQGDQPGPAIRRMQAMGVDAVIVNDSRSEELYHDIAYPAKFAGVLPVLWDSGAGDTIYQVPRRYAGLARVVDARRISAVVDPHTDSGLSAYVDAVENGPEARAASRWRGTDALDVRAATRSGQAVLVQVSYDPAWRAYEGATRLTVREDPMGFMLIDAPPGEHDIRMVFELPLENFLGRILTGLSIAALALLAVRR